MNASIRSRVSLLALALAACDAAGPPAPTADMAAGGRAAAPPEEDEETTAVGAVPPRIETEAPCVLSADCPAGQHCDLGECTQECNSDSGCEGAEICSARGRCLAEGALDVDPPPVTVRVGGVTASPVSATLTDRDDELSIELTSDSEEPVRYRIEVNAPHLSVDETRGEFTMKKVLTLPVDARALGATSAPGSITVHTNLGALVVAAPIRVGVSGRYQGGMTYDGGDIPLGTVAVALGLRETQGEVAVEMDAERSLVFPETPYGPTRGRGTYTHSEGVDFSATTVVSPDFGGRRNHFRRPLGRELRFRLMPGRAGELEGTFTERIHGVMPGPITLSGRIRLERRVSDDVPDIAPPTPVALPVGASGGLDIHDAFPAFAEGDCASILDSPILAEQAYFVDAVNHGPLNSLLEGRLSGTSAPIEEIAATCARELKAGPGDLVGGPRCASPARLACALRDVALSTARGPAETGAFSGLLSHMLTPGLLVAENHVVEGLKTSFLEGLTAQKNGLDEARAAVDPAATWAFSPDVLGYLARVPDFGAPPPDASGQPAHVRALRTMTRLTHLLSTIDGETSRIDAADRAVASANRVREAQERGVLTLFEAAAIVGVLEEWDESAPPDVGSEFIDVLSPLDRGFATLLQGQLSFGVPDGFIPFLGKPGVAGSNFERVLASVEPRLAQLEADETSFLSAGRTYEQNAERLEQELASVQGGIEAQIADLCGAGFAFESARTDEDWGACGADSSGEVGALLLGIEQARGRLHSAHQRIRGLVDRVAIERTRIDDVNSVRKATIAFITETGQELIELRMAEGVLNAAQKCIETAANSNLWNLGAPALGGLVMIAIEGQRTAIDVQRLALQSAQETRIQADAAEVEVINGMATIKTLLVDMAQLQLEMEQEVLGVLQAEVSARNAVARARSLSAQRARALSNIENGTALDPTFRVLEDRAALQTLTSRAEAQRGLFLAGRALEYELNAPFGASLGAAVFNAYNASEATRLRTCLTTIAADAAIQGRGPEAYSTEISLRRLLGIHGKRVDPVTGATLTEAQQFRQLLLKNDTIDESGGVSIEFSSNLESGNELWPANVCEDKIVSVEAQLVGNFQGDDTAQVELALEGGGVLSRCDRSELINWSTSGRAVIQAGVNSFGSASAPNASLAGLSVASARFRLGIPSGRTAPANADLDLQALEDVVLRVRHEAKPGAAGASVSHACLSRIGAGR